MTQASGIARELLAECDRAGLRLIQRGKQIEFAPASAMTADLAGRLRAHKVEVLAYLAQPDGAHDHEGRPLYGCVRCGLHVYARTADSPEWKCASCVRPDPARTDVERCTAPRPARRERRVPFMHPREEGHKAHGPATAEQLAHDCDKSPHSCHPCGCLACMDCGRIIYIEVLDEDEPAGVA